MFKKFLLLIAVILLIAGILNGENLWTICMRFFSGAAVGLATGILILMLLFTVSKETS